MSNRFTLLLYGLARREAMGQYPRPSNLSVVRGVVNVPRRLPA